MKRYKFRLESVLRVRRIEEERAALELAASQRAARAAAQRASDAEAAYHGRLDPSKPGGTATYLSRRALADAAAASVVVARHRSVAAAAAVDERRAEWSEAAGRVSGLERLDERGRDAHQQEELRAEMVAVDDMVTGRHRRDGGQ